MHATTLTAIAPFSKYAPEIDNLCFAFQFIAILNRNFKIFCDSYPQDTDVTIYTLSTLISKNRRCDNLNLLI